MGEISQNNPQTAMTLVDLRGKEVNADQFLSIIFTRHLLRSGAPVRSYQEEEGSFLLGAHIKVTETNIQ